MKKTSQKIFLKVTACNPDCPQEYGREKGR